MFFRVIEDKEFTDVAKRREVLLSKPAFLEAQIHTNKQYNSIFCSADSESAMVSCVLNTSSTNFNTFEISFATLNKRSDVKGVSGEIFMQSYLKVKNFDGSSFKIEGDYVVHRTIDLNPINSQPCLINVYKKKNPKLFAQI